MALFINASTQAAFDVSARSKQLQERVSAFMEAHVYPNEHKIHEEMNQPRLPWTPSPTLEAIKQKAKVGYLPFPPTIFYYSLFNSCSGHRAKGCGTCSCQSPSTVRA
jgi:hypothetical protein